MQGIDRAEHFWEFPVVEASLTVESDMHEMHEQSWLGHRNGTVAHGVSNAATQSSSPVMASHPFGFGLLHMVRRT